MVDFCSPAVLGLSPYLSNSRIPCVRADSAEASGPTTSTRTSVTPFWRMPSSRAAPVGRPFIGAWSSGSPHPTLQKVLYGRPWTRSHAGTRGAAPAGYTQDGTHRRVDWPDDLCEIVT